MGTNQEGESLRLSVIITAFQEPQTIGQAIENILKQIDLRRDQLLVVAPDMETLEVAKNFQPAVELLRDEGVGKPAALNLALRRSGGRIAILTDGDVYIGREAIKSLLEGLDDPEVGIVSGRPVSVNNKETLFGFWAYLLTELVHRLRIEKDKKRQFFDCSGYLLAARRELLPSIPPQLLAEDAFLSRKVFEAGFRIAYASKAKVYVKFPTNLSDWLKQKVRTAGGASKISTREGLPGRSWYREAWENRRFFSFCRSSRQWFYLFLLLAARIYLWLLIYWKLRIRRLAFQQIWQRVESTK